MGEVGGIAHLDLNRRQRTAVPEVVFAQGKTDEQTRLLLAAQRQGEPGFPALATRCPDGVLRAAPAWFPAEPVLADAVGRTVIVVLCRRRAGSLPCSPVARRTCRLLARPSPLCRRSAPGTG